MTNFKKIVFSIILSVCIPFITYADSQNNNTFVIKNVRIFNGQRILPDKTIVVRDGKIAGIGKKSKIPAGAVMIDGTGCTLLPGLIDSHVHIYQENALKQSLIFGVTTVMDMLTDINFLSEMKKQQAAGVGLDRSDFFSAGICVTAPGGHPTQLGIKIPTINGPEEAQAFVDARIAEGADYIKIMYDDGSEFNFNMPTISKDTLAAVVKAAHKRDKKTVVHIETSQFAHDAIAAGADGLAHTFISGSPDDEFYKFAADHKIFVIPTLAVQQPFCGDSEGAALITDKDLAPYLTEMDISNLNKFFPSSPKNKISFSTAKKSILPFKKYGVSILAGTDVLNWGTAYGASLHRELELLVQAGLTPSEALSSATSVPAKIFDLKDRGNIALEQRADLVLVKGDPTKDIKATRNIVGVWKSGIRADRDAYSIAAKAKKKLECSIIEKPAFDVVGKSRKFAMSEVAKIPQFWQEYMVTKEFQKLSEMTNEKRELVTGASILAASLPNENNTWDPFIYAICIEKSEKMDTTDFEVFHVPAATWAVFDCTMETMVDIGRRVWSEWYPSSSDYGPDFKPVIEAYFSEGINKPVNRVQLWYPVVKKK